MEFLMSYGWALLIFLGAVAALLIIVPNNPSLWHRPDHCFLPPGFSCEFQVRGTNVSLVLHNTGGRELEFFNISIESPDLPADCAPAADDGHVIAQLIRNGEQIRGPDNDGILSWNCPDLAGKDYVKLNLLLTWRVAGNHLTQEGTGNLQSRVT